MLLRTSQSLVTAKKNADCSNEKKSKAKAKTCFFVLSFVLFVCFLLIEMITEPIAEMETPQEVLYVL